ncbi:DNA/RNA non-specific endonuclease [Streptomyces erythrochromogenes]|uniref:DNA/RNA non-specific endonuclease n=1 Tax=Streptomyces erythrochromogenes TaxID=285574 RepID=UPI00099B977C|nr:DNA/RNA non-specific endonuclease [Streptomyces erythrochromogenes]
MTLKSPKTKPGRGISLTLSIAAFLSLTFPGVAHAGNPNPVPTSAPALSVTAHTAGQSRQTCSQVPARDRAALGGAAKTCVEFTKASPSRQKPTQPLVSARSLAASSSAGAEPTGACDISNPGEWTSSRLGPLCLTGAQGRYTLYDDQGKVLGTSLIDIDTSLVLSQVSTTLKESISLKVAKVTGEVKSLNIGFAVQCTSTCTPTTRRPWYGQKTLLEGQSATGEVAYNSRVSSGGQDSFQTKYFMTVTANGATAVDPNMNWQSPAELKIRCDDAVGDAGTAPSPGCVVPSIMAVVPMQAQGSDAGAAVAAYQWAQQNLNDGWGKTKPLTRQKSGTAERSSRTCGTFKARDDLIESDTCGEFPFAEAKEGGIDGARCVELIPNASSGGWDTYVLGNSLDHDRAAPCARAHLSPADKQFAHQKLAEGFQNQRVIDGDQFKVDISSPTQAAQAACLQNPPAGSVPSGNGWRKNTTKSVDHVNRMITPKGPAGTRPSLAQACLGKTPGKGKAASGNITGWADAAKFRDDFSPGTSQARCHLIANILGGPGQIEDGGQDNLVPCWQVGMNTGTPSMRTFEREAQEEVKKSSFGPDDAIFYQVNPVFRDDTSTIPVGVTMSATIERANGTTEELFPSVYVPNSLRDTGTLNLGN